MAATTSGVMLTSLNKHTVMNDQEFDSTIGAVDRANRAYNWNNTVVIIIITNTADTAF